jgi:hypothetical protein
MSEIRVELFIVKKNNDGSFTKDGEIDYNIPAREQYDCLTWQEAMARVQKIYEVEDMSKQVITIREIGNAY